MMHRLSKSSAKLRAMPEDSSKHCPALQFPATLWTALATSARQAMVPSLQTTSHAPLQAGTFRREIHTADAWVSSSCDCSIFT